MERLDLTQEEDDLKAKEFLTQFFKDKIGNQLDGRILFLGWEDHEHGVYKICIMDQDDSSEGVTCYMNLFSTNINIYRYLFENKHFRYDRIENDEVHFIRQSDYEDIVFFKREDNPVLFKQYKNYNAQVEIWMSSLEDWVPADKHEFAQTYMDSYLEEIERGWQ